MTVKSYLAVVPLFLLLMQGCDMSVVYNPQAVFSEEETHNARELLIGNWYGERTSSDGEQTRWLVSRRRDGIYFIEFHILEPDGRLDTFSETGVWGVRLPIYFTAVRGVVEGETIQPADTSQSYYYDAYRVVSLDTEQFTYDSHTSGTRFTVNKVDDDFEL